MSSAADGEPSFSLQTSGREPAVDGAADACLPMPTRQRPALTLFPDNMTQSKDPLAPAAHGQTFGALGGSRHVELQANPCVFGIDCSAIFYDEVHESVVTVQPSAAKQGSMLTTADRFNDRLCRRIKAWQLRDADSVCRVHHKRQVHIQS